MAPLLHRQPWKSLYLFVFLIQLLLVKIPYWIIASIPASRRPRTAWTIKKCIHVYIMRELVQIPAKLGISVKRDLTVEVSDSSLRNAKFVWIPGLVEDRIRGEIKEYAEKAKVKPMKIPGYWQYKPGTVTQKIQPPKDDEKIIYHMHGGSLHFGSAHPVDYTARIPRGILKYSKQIGRTFAVDYRLSSSEPFVPENPFPSALLDCIAGYQYLLDLGFSSKNVTFVGDSAGGNLCLAVVRYLIQYPETGIPVPEAIFLSSPWGDITYTKVEPTDSLIKNMKSDMFVPRPPNNRTAYGTNSYIRNVFSWEEASKNPYLSPSSRRLEKKEGLFKGYPKTYILAGDAERILDDSKILAERIRADNPEPNWVTLDIVVDEIHDFIIFPWCEPSRTEAFKRVAAWLDEL